MHEQVVVQMSKMLRNLEGMLAKAAAFAEAKGCAPDSFVGFSLAPDMRPLSFQIQAASDTAKFAVARLTDVEAPSFPDDETTLDQLRERLAKTAAFLEGVEAKAFEGAEAREVRLHFLPGKWVRGDDYLREFALPNLYFHVSIAYALLRMAGVSVGKLDYVGSMKLHDDPA
ncbi:DUF1993 domain-containing protein [Pseudenhygromyxa sp. WMMC2535]|nr:DUF1993 domain-containing protein [Pseudenhygromyxa sp. WMMC2535]